MIDRHSGRLLSDFTLKSPGRFSPRVDRGCLKPADFRKLPDGLVRGLKLETKILKRKSAQARAHKPGKATRLVLLIQFPEYKHTHNNKSTFQGILPTSVHTTRSPDE